MPEGDKKENNVFLYLLLGGCLITIVTSFYFFYFKKDYQFIVETSCNPEKETCFQRDCSNPDDCPPDRLSNFKRFTLNAGDFKFCEKEDCTQVCEKGVISCTQIECAEDELARESCTILVEPELKNISTENSVINE